MIRKLIVLVLLPLLLNACGTAEPVWAPQEQVAAARFVAAGPKSLTLYTVINNRSGNGAHSGLMINASQRVIFDPAGTFKASTLPERNDVIFGITDRAREIYIDYHARETFHVIVQEIEVSPAVAEQALQLVQAYGAVPKAQCSNSITTILRQLPGFEGMIHTWYPGKAATAFGALPNVRTSRVYDNDSDDNKAVLRKAQDL